MNPNYCNVHSILSWEVVTIIMRLFYVLQLSSALKKVHSMGILHGDLKPQNFLLLNGQLLLADFGGTKVEESIVAQQQQTGIFSMFWADSKARMGKYSMASEVYAFGVCAHFLIWGQPLFHKGNQKEYLTNTVKSKNTGYDGVLLQGIINWCLSDTEERPTFLILEMEVFCYLLSALVEVRNAEDDAKAVDLIKNYATLPILNY